MCKLLVRKIKDILFFLNFFYSNKSQTFDTVVPSSRDEKYKKIYNETI